MHPTITFIPRARAMETIFQASRIPVHFISLMLMPEKAPAREGMSRRRWVLSSAKMGRGERSVSQALSSNWPTGSGCSTITTPCEASQ